MNARLEVQPGELLSRERTVRQWVWEHEWRLQIGGSGVEPAAGRFESTVDPGTEQEIARVPVADAADVAQAVEAARASQFEWARVAPRDRGRILRELAHVVREHTTELAALDALDGGFPVSNMCNDVGWAVDLLELFAEWGMALGGETIPASPNFLHYTIRSPFGVVGRIVPFNHPIFFAVGKVAAPLMAGNAVVLKPADQTPLSALRFAELTAEVLPPGLVNVVTGRGDSGRALVAHPAVRRVAFIGSDVVGRSIQRQAAEAGVKSVSLELGGKNAMIVLPDADLARASLGAVTGMNFISSAGQSCGSNSRVLVHADVAEEFSERVVSHVEALRLGAPLDTETQVGPLISAQQRKRTEEYVSLGHEAGARLLAGGRRPSGFDRGYFYEPTVFSDVPPRSRLGQEEVFGPLMALMTFKSISEAIEVANDVDFGLTGSIWTRDIDAAHSLAQQLEAGYIWVNGSSRHFWGVPFGGVKASGVGREEGLEELLSFTETKAVNVVLDSVVSH